MLVPILLLVAVVATVILVSKILAQTRDIIVMPDPLKDDEKWERFIKDVKSPPKPPRPV
jgi:hypothetical protein